MDRLICGDVGYGKTEVALRAAFKAVMDGKQVAVLVPTTVLAQQHFTTFPSACGPSRSTWRCSRASRRPAEQQEHHRRLGQRQRGHRHRHAPPAEQGRGLQETWAC